MTRTQSIILSELLVLQAQGGCSDALSQLAEIWTPRLSTRAYRLTLNEDGTQEVVQETWIGIARGLRSLKDPSRFGPWSLKIVHHKAADWIRLKSRHRSLESHIRHAGQQRQQEPSPANDLRLTIRTAIGLLDPRLREVVCLFYMDNCTLEQIACALDIPVGTAKTRLMRARDQLRPLLERSTP